MEVTSPSVELEPRRSLLLRGVLDMCVLALLQRQPDHVYGLVGRLAERGLTKVSFGSLYPLVTRLRQQGLVDDITLTSSLSPLRSVLSVTAAGRVALERWTEQWRTMNTTVNQLLADDATGPVATATEEGR
jgi:PadR family transcriptional regulator PadR